MAEHIRRAPEVFDHWRAQMVRGDALRKLPDKDREWTMRSLLKGVRRAEVMRLACVDDQEMTQALVRVKRWYDQRLDAYKRRIEQDAQHPKVVRAVAPAAAPRRRGLFGLFGKGR